MDDRRRRLAVVAIAFFALGAASLRHLRGRLGPYALAAAFVPLSFRESGAAELRPV